MSKIPAWAWWLGGGVVAIGVFAVARSAMAGELPASPTAAPALPPKKVLIPDGDGASLSVAPGQRVDIAFTKPLPVGYQWTANYQADMLVSTAFARTTVTSSSAFVSAATRGKARINFIAYAYDAGGQPLPWTPIGPYHIDLVVE